MREPMPRASKLCGWIASACLAAMMLFTVADVVLGAICKYPLRGTYEIVEILLCATFFVALPAVFLRDGHIVVDAIDRHLPRVVPWLKHLARSIAVVLLGLMAWQGSIAARDSWSFGDRTADLSLPQLLYWMPLLFGLAGGAVAALVRLVREGRS
jgi:TRAP-type C4-dicarboxylate transport system permease small subunit